MADTKQNSALKKLGFDAVVDLKPKKAVVSLYGLEKCGKSYTMLTFPRPLAIFNFDQGLERANAGKKTPDGVYSKTYVIPKLDGDAEKGVSPKYMRLWDQFLEDIDAVINSPGVKSVGIDTATAAWELCRLAYLGKLTQVKPHHYGPPNAAWKGFMMQLRNSPVNACLLHKGGYEYQTVKTKDGKPILNAKGETQDVKTDNVVRKGQNEVGFDVDLECGLRVVDKRHELEIVTNGFNRGVEGQVLKGEGICFAGLMTRCIEGSEWEDWE